MEVLEQYGVYGVSIWHWTTTLRLLYDAVPQRYSRLKPNPRQGENDASTPNQFEASGATSLPDWRPTGSGGLSLSTFYDPAKEFNHENSFAATAGAFPNFDTNFDPNDFSWLMTVPLNG